MTTKENQQQMPQTLADLRRARGLSQAQMAERIGVNQPRISQIERDFPNLHYQVVANYFRALDDNVTLVVGDIHIDLGGIQPDPRSPGAQTNRNVRLAKGMAHLTSRTAKELPLEQSQPHTGADDTGREVDQPDPQRDQADREDGQQP